MLGDVVEEEDEGGGTEFTLSAQSCMSMNLPSTSIIMRLEIILTSIALLGGSAFTTAAELERVDAGFGGTAFDVGHC